VLRWLGVLPILFVKHRPLKKDMMTARFAAQAEIGPDARDAPYQAAARVRFSQFNAVANMQCRGRWGHWPVFPNARSLLLYRFCTCCSKGNVRRLPVHL
jgi:hypothetical protein